MCPCDFEEACANVEAVLTLLYRPRSLNIITKFEYVVTTAVLKLMVGRWKLKKGE